MGLLCNFLYSFSLLLVIFETQKIGENRLDILNSPKKLPKQGKKGNYSNSFLKLYIIHVVQSDEKFFSFLKSDEI
jgi:hypothetical protein